MRTAPALQINVNKVMSNFFDITLRILNRLTFLIASAEGPVPSKVQRLLDSNVKLSLFLGSLGFPPKNSSDAKSHSAAILTLSYKHPLKKKLESPLFQGPVPQISPQIFHPPQFVVGEFVACCLLVSIKIIAIEFSGNEKLRSLFESIDNGIDDSVPITFTWQPS